MKQATRELLEHNRKTVNRFSHKGRKGAAKIRKALARRLWEFGTRNFANWILRGIQPQ